MDKRKNNTITIKMNGEAHTYQPVQDKPGGEKEIVKEDSGSMEEQAAGLEAEEEHFEWILPEQEPAEPEEFIINEAVNTAAIYPKQTQSLSKKKKGPIKPIFFTVAFAVLIGLTFGAVMLKLVLTDKPVVTSADPQLGEKAAGESSGKEKPGKTAVAAAAKLPPVTAFVVQEGVYSTKEAAAQVKTGLEAKDVPAAILEMDGKYMLLIGLAGTLEEAKEIGASMKAKGIDFYAKEIGLAERKAGKATASEKDFLAKAPEIYDVLSAAAAAAYSGKNAPSIEKEAGFLKEMDGAKFANDKIAALYNELEKAAGSLAAFEKNGASKDSLSAQQHLLNFLEQSQSF
ncbi:hypothetical protein [Bacillus sp. B-jedd]|uniref:hypothetical protein n=1 Tax=Bacillus sp. B-jedd TaxID=1476857 RepID=UPI000B183CB1|nr:hypothetical protein [Bacillus sp. B-jedd]